MRGLLGWQGAAPENSFETMWRGAGRSPPATIERQDGGDATLAAWGGSLYREAGLDCAIAGRPLFDDPELQALPAAVALARLWRRYGPATLDEMVDEHLERRALRRYLRRLKHATVFAFVGAAARLSPRALNGRRYSIPSPHKNTSYATLTKATQALSLIGC